MSSVGADAGTARAHIEDPEAVNQASSFPRCHSAKFVMKYAFNLPTLSAPDRLQLDPTNTVRPSFPAQQTVKPSVGDHNHLFPDSSPSLCARSGRGEAPSQDVPLSQVVTLMRSLRGLSLRVTRLAPRLPRLIQSLCSLCNHYLPRFPPTLA